MTLAQLGADAIRIDPIGGNIGAHRWPIGDDGASIYWEGLNKADAQSRSTSYPKSVKPGFVEAPFLGFLSSRGLCRGLVDPFGMDLDGRSVLDR